VPDGGAANDPQIASEAGGTAQGQRAVYAFLPTFQGTNDNTPRRAADIVGGFHGCAWGCEYLSFNVGSNSAANDAGNLNIERMRITGSGNVGIGTSNPTGELVVSGAGQTTANLATAGSLGGALDLDDTAGNPGNGGALIFSAYSQSWKFASMKGFVTNGNGYSQGDITFSVRPSPANLTLTEAMRIQSSGHVGIGTANPQYPLSVNGVIQAKEVLVNTGWSDYVFAPNYKLRSLNSTAAYIKEHHHLPDMPSAEQVKNRGVPVGEVESKLLAKVEELTLQMIKLNESNENLKSQVAELKKKVAEK
jgi:hypothetical protein